MLPIPYESTHIETNGVRLHVVTAGPKDGKPVILLHGFPEFWYGWRRQIPALAAAGLRVIVPDQRGYNLSDKPKEIEQYRVKHMVADLAALADRLSPGRPFVLAGHDWGASVAYAYAFSRPERLTHLVIANGPHPWTFQTAILDDPGQRAASQ